MDAYGKKEETVESPSGRTFRGIRVGRSRR
jgi:hypothetical protein